MQTFLPYPSFPHSAAVLDYRRLGKQRLECIQLLRALKLSRGFALPDEPPHSVADMLADAHRIGWANHPAARQWRGFEAALALYMTFMVREWVGRGYKNTIQTPYDDDWRPVPDLPFCGPLPPVDEVRMPPWLGENVYHATHRSKLLSKDEAWYSQFGWREGPGLEYVWPEGLGIDAVTTVVS